MEDNREKWALAKMAKVLKVSVSGYYKWKSRGKRSRQQSDEKLYQEMMKQSKRFRNMPGVRVMTAILRESSGKPINHKRVQRVMHKYGLLGLSRRGKKKVQTTDSRHNRKYAENLLNREFMADKPKEKMVSDTTYIWTREGYVYLAAILDLYGRKIVGMALSKNNDQHLVMAALEDAKKRCKRLEGCLMHSDRGSTYCSTAYQEKLKEYKCVCSMSRKGNCWDNAPMESFWNTLKLEALDRPIANLEEARHLCMDYIWFYYNCRRLHSSNSYQTPNQYQKKPFREQKAA